MFYEEGSLPNTREGVFFNFSHGTSLLLDAKKNAYHVNNDDNDDNEDNDDNDDNNDND